MPKTSGPIEPDRLRIVPANQAAWDDLAAIFGTADAGHCQCQRFKVQGWIWRDSTLPERTAALRAQTACGNPDAEPTSGLVAFVDDEPAAWVAVEPRTAYPRRIDLTPRSAGRRRTRPRVGWPGVAHGPDLDRR
jgi:hypothetical protein